MPTPGSGVGPVRPGDGGWNGARAGRVLEERSRPQSFEEVAMTTGKSHGAFFQPRAEWLRPLKAWIAKTNR